MRLGRSAWCLILLAAACSGGGALGGGPDLPRIGLARGMRWSLLALRPPHLFGQHFNLTLQQGVLSGVVSGGSAPGGGLHVRIDEEGAAGRGPLGPVVMDFFPLDDTVTAEGLWNGRRVHLVFRPDSLRGTVADNSGFEARLEPAPPVRDWMRALDPPARDSSCEYYLDEPTSDGALAGGSICSGMPQPTRLEIPRAAGRLLTRPELITVLVAMLSAPPVPVSEVAGAPRGR